MTVLSDLKAMQLRACAVNPYDDEVLKLTIKRLEALYGASFVIEQTVTRCKLCGGTSYRLGVGADISEFNVDKVMHGVRCPMVGIYHVSYVGKTEEACQESDVTLGQAIKIYQLEQKVVELTNKLAKIKEAVQW